MELFIGTAIYILVGMFVGKWYWQRRHGVYKKVLNGGSDVVFSSVFPISFVWPILLFLPKFRDPELCMCPDHVMARDQARQAAAAYEAALDRENGRG
ncbi:hypothetical protein [Prescottella agglutinans]|uniref:Uncharacterized protein n=1 Tax=Prescottella agglutinans TaxID=1644129 RepID=A0ABT6MMS0_9NOCA|nr:hypothetical protein [Prescottella agglutinans]MDH6284934.1 hypothetical protein [Prescottella agglutinans]